jgi:hypothetical protein
MFCEPASEPTFAAEIFVSIEIATRKKAEAAIGSADRQPIVYFFGKSGLIVKVASFFLVRDTKTGKNVPN